MATDTGYERNQLAELEITTTALLDLIESTSNYDLQRNWTDIRGAARVIRRILDRDIAVGIEVIPADDRELDICFGSTVSTTVIDRVTLAIFELLGTTWDTRRYMPGHLRLHVHLKKARELERIIKDKGLSLRPVNPLVDTLLSSRMKDLLLLLTTNTDGIAREDANLGSSKGLFKRKLVVPTWSTDEPEVEILTLHRPKLTELGWKKAVDVELERIRLKEPIQ